MHVLFVFQQRAVQRRDELASIALSQQIRTNILGQ